MPNVAQPHREVANNSAEVRTRLSSSSSTQLPQAHLIHAHPQDHRQAHSPRRHTRLRPIKSKDARLKRASRPARNSSVDSCLYLIGGDGQSNTRVDRQLESKHLSNAQIKLKRQFRSTQTLSYQQEALSYCRDSVGRKMQQRDRLAKRSHIGRESISNDANMLDQCDLHDNPAKLFHIHNDPTQRSTLSTPSHKSSLASEMGGFVARLTQSGPKRASVSDSPSTSSLSTTTSIDSNATSSQRCCNQATNLNGQHNTIHIHRGQYSSSQAHLQSLAPIHLDRSTWSHSDAAHRNKSPAISSTSASYTNSSLKRSSASATPISHSIQAAPRSGQFHSRSQQQLFSAPSNANGATQTSNLTNDIGATCLQSASSSSLQNNSTKPMTSSMMAHQQQLEANSSQLCGQAAQKRLSSMPFIVTSVNSPLQQQVAGSYMRSQTATTSHQFVDHSHNAQLPPPYSSVVGQVSGSEQQPSGQLPSGVRHQSSAAPTMTPIVQPQARSIFNLQPTCQLNHQHQLQQQVAPASSGASQEPAPAEPSASRQPQANIAPGQQQQQQQLLAAAAANAPAILPNANYQLLNGRAQLMVGAGFTKSKSCLACADISIKWYIVVIALLGLICALIGTIVGAVHSVGRDYISLSLLLLGVGLVLIAISWIALRIAINTYKSTSASSLGPLQTSANLHSRAALTTNSLGRGLNSSGGLLANSHNHQQQHANRLHGHRNHHQFLISQQQQQQQALINERLYMMAAAAAAANSSMQRSMGPMSRPGPSQANRTSQRLSSILRSIKERMPRFLAKMISNPSASADESDSVQPQTSSDHSPRATSDHSQLQTGASTLATLLQQYRMLPAQHQASLLFAPNGLASSLHPQPIHLLAAAAGVGPVGLGLQVHDPIFQPPPPSYSAAMQDQRIRMIMQERATLQQLQQSSLGASVRRQPTCMPPPPPPPPSISNASFDGTSQNNYTQRQSAHVGSNQSSSSTIGGTNSMKQTETSQQPDKSFFRSKCDAESRVIPSTTEVVLSAGTGSNQQSELQPTPTVTSEKTECANLPTVINIGENETTICGAPQVHER